jgi:Fe2+ transport system protein FeoA
MSWADYIEWDKIWLAECDALLFLGNSKGANLELEIAKKLGKPIFFNVNSVPIALSEKDRVTIEL